MKELNSNWYKIERQAQILKDKTLRQLLAMRPKQQTLAYRQPVFLIIFMLSAFRRFD